MLNFLLGSLFGGTMGVITMCLCTAAKWGDEHLKQPLALSRQLVGNGILDVPKNKIYYYGRPYYQKKRHSQTVPL